MSHGHEQGDRDRCEVKTGFSYDYLLFFEDLSERLYGHVCADLGRLAIRQVLSVTRR